MQPMRLLRLLLVLCCVVPTVQAAVDTAAAKATAVHRYAVLSQGKPAGRQVVEQFPGNRSKVEFTYRDNGRGPDLFEELTLDGSGLLTSFVATGKSTFGAPIDETFSISAGKATWKSKADRGDRAASGGAIYVPIENSFETIAITARALLRAPGQKLAALPNGRLAIEKITEADVVSKAGKGRVTLYAITGFGIEPSYLWLRSGAGGGNRLLAVVLPSFYVVEEGWEDNCDAMLKIQLEADAARLKKLAMRLSHRSDVPVVFRNVRWFDAENAVMKGPSDVHVFRGRIAAIFPPNSPLRDAANLIDGTGKSLLPGLADLHGHTSAWDAVLQVAGGITTLRDMGGDNAELKRLTKPPADQL